MDSQEKNEKTPDALAVQLVGSDDRGNYAIAHDLKTGKIWKRFNLDGQIKEIQSWGEIYNLLMKECPPYVVKTETFYGSWFESVEVIGICVGYVNLNFLSTMITNYTTELLLAKKNGRKYEIGDYILFGSYPSMNFGHVHLLKKQKVGWNFVDGKIIPLADVGADVLHDFLSKNDLYFNSIKSFFIRMPSGFVFNIVAGRLMSIFGSNKVIVSDVKSPFAENKGDYLEFFGEYLSKVYAGEEYFNDYDCFVGNVCFEKFELVCGSSTIVLPVQFKRVPFTMKKKIKFTKCKGVKLLTSLDNVAFFYPPIQGKRVLFSSNVDIDDEVVIVTLQQDKHLNYLFKIEKNNDEKTLITSSRPLDEWEDDRPRVIVAKSHCCAGYYKEGLLWELKDANGNDKIPFKISFGNEIYVGEAASNHDEQFNVDLDVLINQSSLKTWTKKNPNAFINDSGEVKFLIKTCDGIRKVSPEMILAIFI
uniref:Uncharacterized protein n=1 Tax=Panagrolaimus sp. JU765 TaxID=591449 RepID=A0AC34Q3Z1_9BILA